MKPEETLPSSITIEVEQQGVGNWHVNAYDSKEAFPRPIMLGEFDTSTEACRHVSPLRDALLVGYSIALQHASDDLGKLKHALARSPESVCAEVG